MTSASKQRLKAKVKSRRRWAYRRGLIAEKIAEILLFLKGYRIAGRRYRKPVGEIDLIATRKHMIIAVEVKMRKNMDEALHSITTKQQRRIRRALEMYVAAHPEYADYDMRFDIVLVTSFIKKPLHMENVW